MKKLIGYFRCLKCGHEWKSEILNSGTACVKCAHNYVEWLNYEELRKEFFIGY